MYYAYDKMIQKVKERVLKYAQKGAVRIASYTQRVRTPSLRIQITILVLILAAILGIAGVRIYILKTVANKAFPSQPLNSPLKQEASALPLSKTYTDDAGYISLSYPANWKLTITKNEQSADLQTTGTAIFTSPRGVVLHVDSDWGSKDGACFPRNTDTPYHVGNLCPTAEYLSSEPVPLDGIYNYTNGQMFDHATVVLVTKHYADTAGNNSWSIDLTQEPVTLHKPVMGYVTNDDSLTVYDANKKFYPNIHAFAVFSRSEDLDSQDAQTIKAMLKSLRVSLNPATGSASEKTFNFITNTSGWQKRAPPDHSFYVKFGAYESYGICNDNPSILLFGIISGNANGHTCGGIMGAVTPKTSNNQTTIITRVAFGPSETLWDKGDALPVLATLPQGETAKRYEYTNIIDGTSFNTIEYDVSYDGQNYVAVMHWPSGSNSSISSDYFDTVVQKTWTFNTTSIVMSAIKIEPGSSYSLPGHPPINGNLQVIHMTIKNNSGTEQSYQPLQFSAVTSSGSIINPTQYAPADTQNEWYGSSLVPGGSQNIVIFFTPDATLTTLTWASDSETIAIPLSVPPGQI